MEPIYGARLQGLICSMAVELANNNFDCTQWNNHGYMSSSQNLSPSERRAKTDNTDSLIDMLSVSSECAKGLTK